LWTVMEYCNQGEFFDIVVAEKHFSESKAKKYFIQLCQGVAYMHAHLICHLDLSLENLLMDSNGDLKICDFGLARVMKLDQDKHISPFEGIQKNKPGKVSAIELCSNYR
jgi:serine/threonine protein kinase